MIKAVVCGACGKMGKKISSIIYSTEGIELAGAIEHADHPFLGKNIEEIIGFEKTDIEISDNLRSVFENCDVVIDFSSPDATDAIVKESKRQGKALVIGTTGLSNNQVTEIEKDACEIPCVYSPNMSIGITVLFSLLKKIAPVFEDGYDIEIIESHHRLKKDAPSGTALKMASIIADTLHRDLNKVGCYERRGNIGKRPEKEIGIQTIRAGDIVGDHTVLFGGIGERIEITHKAQNRDTFAKGAVRAAKWITGKQPGLYDMQDVLQLK